MDGGPLEQNYLMRAQAMLAPYGPDGQNSYVQDNIGILYYPFHTTSESRREVQPLSSVSGPVLTWDGTLHNRNDLVRELSHNPTANSSDVDVVASAYLRWGTECFPKLIGDWAISIWDPGDQSLILAKDPIGTRHLYYSFSRLQVTWSTILDPLTLLAETELTLDEEYVAGWLSSFPASHLTPYAEISAVRPSTFVRLRASNAPSTISYWDFNVTKSIRYPTDSHYEEHFRSVFRQAVQRRLFSDRPVLAELSGGMDSSSIVCMADRITSDERSEGPRLDTVSYYDDSEPNWNERPYFAKVEEQRGRVGYHINISSEGEDALGPEDGPFAASPAGYGRHRSIANRLFATHVGSKGSRAVLSGIGGDEVTGGVPSPQPLLMDLLAGIRLPELAHQLKVWALNKRKPWFHLFLEAIAGFLPPSFVGPHKLCRPAPWLTPSFVRRHRAPLTGYPTRFKFFGPRPTFQDNLSSLEALRRQLACIALSVDPLIERRYPYLDRNLLEFLFAIPSDQLLQPGYRRSLMRRALKGIVPDEILNRRRKAYLTQTPLTVAITQAAQHFANTATLLSSTLGIVDDEALRQTIDRARRGEEVPLVSLLKTNTFEAWLRSVVKHLGSRIQLDPRNDKQPSSYKSQSRPSLDPKGKSFNPLRLKVSCKN
jgi:asparagine synthase (glutamine-hydrolysing)